VARGTQHRKRRPAANARVAQPEPKAKPQKKQHPSWEDQLFFSRLRVHAKWMFVFLALVFAVGFVIFGVGSGSTGISDVLQNFFNGSSSSGSSLSALQKKTVEQPKNAKAWRDLATKLEQDSKDDEAIAALTTYTTLKPSDQDALRELAGIYLRRAQAYNTLYSEARARTQALIPTSIFQPKPGSKLAQAVTSLPNQVASAVTSQISTETGSLYSKLLGYLSQRLDIYKKLAALSPKDATTQFELAQAAQDSGDAQTAVTALKKFLALAPDDSLAPTARKVLKQLEASLGTSPTATANTSGG
jgi:tetratricopeptide (TPR) repeat protein